jgi:hypothetical protein
MTKRIFVAASLLATFCAAHADVLPTSTTSTGGSSFLDHWTDSNGRDVASSNALGTNVHLIGGVALGNESAAQALMKKASADAASGSAVTVKRSDGISGVYAVASSNYKAAAAAGNGTSVVSKSNGDILVTKGRSGGGAADGGGAGGSAGAGGSGSAVAAAGGTSGSASGSTGASTAASTAAKTLTTASIEPGNLGTLPAGAASDTGVGGAGSASGAGSAASPSGEVPEPSSIALMFAGLIGAMSVARRRAR